MQLFNKTLRNKGYKFKFFAAGEYGTQNGRAHYHIIYLGIPKSLNLNIELEHYWKNGTVYVGDVTTASMRYVAGYIMDKDKPDTYLPALPPFLMCSHNIGKGWIIDNLERAVKDGYITGNKGQKLAIPKFITDLYDIKKGPTAGRLSILQKLRKDGNMTDNIIEYKQKKANNAYGTRINLEAKKNQRERQQI